MPIIRREAGYFIEQMPELDELIASGKPDTNQLDRIAAAERIGDVFRFKLFDKQGAVTLVSDEAAYAIEDASSREHSAKAAEVLRTGISNVSLNDGTGKKEPSTALCRGLCTDRRPVGKPPRCRRSLYRPDENSRPVQDMFAALASACGRRSRDLRPANDGLS